MSSSCVPVSIFRPHVCRSGSVDPDPTKAEIIKINGANWAKGSFGTALHFTRTDSYATLPQLARLDSP